MWPLRRVSHDGRAGASRSTLLSGDTVNRSFRILGADVGLPRRRSGHLEDTLARQLEPAHPPWRLALVTVLQFAEGLPDRQAANAVRGRIDWKYALGLELADPGFDHSIPCEFSACLIAGSIEHTLLGAMLARLRELRLLQARGTPAHGQHPRAGNGADGEPAGKRR